MRARPEWALCALAYALILPALLCACVSNGSRDRGAFDFVTNSARNTQLALTGLIALDTAQTVTIARSPECLFEANPIAAAIYGSRTPSPQRVILFNALYTAGHWLLGSYLDRKANAPVDLSVSPEEDIARRKRWRFARGLYQLLTALGHGTAIVNNEAKGIRPFSSFDCGGAQ